METRVRADALRPGDISAKGAVVISTRQNDTGKVIIHYLYNGMVRVMAVWPSQKGLMSYLAPIGE